MKKTLIVTFLTISAQNALANPPQFLVCFTSQIPDTNSSLSGEMIMEETIRNCLNSRDNNREHPILENLSSKLTRILRFQSIIESVMGKNGMLPNNTSIVARITQCDSRAKKITNGQATIHHKINDWKQPTYDSWTATYNGGRITISIAGDDNQELISNTRIPTNGQEVTLEYGEPYSGTSSIETGTAIVCNVRQLIDYKDFNYR